MFNTYLTSEIEKVLPSVCKQNSGQVLENRENTIGGSEIGSCPLKVVLSKRIGVEAEPSTLWHFLRGHTREIALDPIQEKVAHQNGWYLTNQPRIYHPDNKRMRVHIDRVFHNHETLADSTMIYVVEEKCPGVLPDTPWDSWVSQLQYQMGLVALNYPQAQVRGSIYATDMTGAHTDYGIKFKLSRGMFENLVQKAKSMLSHLDNGTDPKPQEDMLCGFCPFRLTHCPKFCNAPEITSPEIISTVLELIELGGINKQTNARMREIKKHLQQMFTSKENPKFKGKIGDRILSIGQRKGRTSIDSALLQDQYPDAYKACAKQGKPYSVVETK